MRRRIQPGWRYTLAQKVLSLLFGRPWHYISPWQKAGIAAVLILTSNNRVLLGQRGGDVEYVGCWSGIGGFVELGKNETFAQALCREMLEETELAIDHTRFPPSPQLSYMVYGQQKNEEANTCAAAGYYIFNVPASFADKFHITEEVTAYQWFTEKEVEAMIADGRIPADFTDLHASIRETFRSLKAGQTFPPLPI